jgi:hypothetical protein
MSSPSPKGPGAASSLLRSALPPRPQNTNRPADSQPDTAKPFATAAPRAHEPLTGQASVDASLAAFAQLLKIEADARRAANERELSYLIANDTLGLVRARQVFVLGQNAGTRQFQIRAVSSLALVDRNVPLLRWIEALVARLSDDVGLKRAQTFTLAAYTDPGDSITSEYPFANMLWLPLWSRNEASTDGFLLSRDTPWLETDVKIAVRLAETYGHALLLLRSPKPMFRRKLPRSKLLAAILAAGLILAFVPVRMSALAPAEVGPRDAIIAAMPIDGIVERVLVNPNDAVVAGQPLVRLVNTVARNKLELAEREVAVAEARLEQASSLAFSDPKGRHDLGISHAELALRVAERNFARDMLDKSVIVADAGGIAIYSDKKDLEGKPLSTGDRLMQIAKPGIVELRIDLPVADSIVLEPGASVRAFLDSDPLKAYAGKVTHVDYNARVSETHVAVHRVIAHVTDDARSTPRLGTRGTAQIEGPKATLGLYLFRRPISALRQWVGL